MSLTIPNVSKQQAVSRRKQQTIHWLASIELPDQYLYQQILLSMICD